MADLAARVASDLAQTPWEVVLLEKGTENELLRKTLKQPDGTNVTSADIRASSSGMGHLLEGHHSTGNATIFMNGLHPRGAADVEPLVGQS